MFVLLLTSLFAVFCRRRLARNSFSHSLHSPLPAARSWLLSRHPRVAAWQHESPQLQQRTRNIRAPSMVFKTVFVLLVAAFALPLCHSLPLAKVSIASFNSNGSAANAQYTYSQSSGRFHGKAYDGGYIDVTGCSGAQGSCRNNPRCQCDRDVGPLPRATFVVVSTCLIARFCSAHSSLQLHHWARD